jgi:hypothetical protein
MKRRQSPKRLTDAEVAAGWDQNAHARSLAMQYVREDHDLARKDAARLVAMFLKIQESGGIPGWAAHDVAALLREVSP